MKVDPANAEKYAKRADAYLKEVLRRAQKRRGTDVLHGKKANIVTMHGALKYFERNFDGSI